MIAGRRRLAQVGLFLLAVLACGISPRPALADEESLWAALRSGGHLIIMRHALAPGTGDPQDFVLDDCSTQRNLSEEGRDQARRIGARFREKGIATARVFSSQWCRCLETAALLGLGPVEPLPALNSFFRARERAEPQTRALKDWIAEQPLDAPLLLVTHQVNITALTDVFPASGEMLVLRRSGGGGLSVLGSIRID